MSSSETDSEEETPQAQKGRRNNLVKIEKQSSSDSSSGESSVNTKRKQTLTAPVTPTVRRKLQTTKHDISESDRSSDSDDSGTERASKGNSKQKETSPIFSESASDSDAVGSKVTGIISGLSSPIRKRSSQVSSVGSSNLTLGGLKFSPLRTPACSRSILDTSVFSAGNSSSEDSASEEDTFKTPLKKVQKVAENVFANEEALKFECPKAFKEMRVGGESNVWNDDLEGKELWLIKAPLDMDSDWLSGENPYTVKTILKRETTKGGETMLWKTKTVHENGKRVNDYAVVMPAERSKRLKYAGEFTGELHVFKSYETKAYTIPQSTKVTPQMPVGLRMRYVPFGSGKRCGEEHIDTAEANQTSTERQKIKIESPTKKRKKKKKSIVEKELKAEEFVLEMAEADHECITEQHDINVESTKHSDIIVESTKKKKKKNKRSTIENELKPEEFVLDFDNNSSNLQINTSNELHTNSTSKKKKKNLKQEQNDTEGIEKENDKKKFKQVKSESQADINEKAIIKKKSKKKNRNSDIN